MKLENWNFWIEYWILGFGLSMILQAFKPDMNLGGYIGVFCVTFIYLNKAPISITNNVSMCKGEEEKE